MNAKEVVVRVARLPGALTPVPIYAGEPPAPIDCAWLVISRVQPETFVLYFVGSRGEIHELLQFETLRIALDQAHAIAGFPQSEWTTCDSASPLLDDGMDIDALAALLSGSR